MIYKIVRWLFNLLVVAVLPAVVFFGSYQATDVYFREKLIPYPFELFGLVIGAGCACWALGIGILLTGFFRKKETNPMKTVVSIVLLLAGIFSYRFAAAESGDASSSVLAKLSSIEQKQDTILQQLDEIKAELQIVKVRASRG